MRDPHVKSLRYRVVPSEGVTFDQPPPVQWDTDDFHMTLEDNVATVEMRKHYASKEAAQQAVEPDLRRWEVEAALHSNGVEIQFDFDAAEIIDRDPPPPGTPQVVYGEVAMAAAGVMSAKANVTRKRYPEPPKTFVLSPDVETMWFLFRGYLDGHVRLTDMAYFCLTVLERRAGGRPAASKCYLVSLRVLDKLGHLSSKVGNEQMARKMPLVPRDHTPEEVAWIKAAVKALIRRMGQCAYDPAFAWPQVTMKDLPHLP